MSVSITVRGIIGRGNTVRGLAFLLAFAAALGVALPAQPQEAAPVQPFQLRFDLGHVDGRFVTLVAHRLSSISAGTVTIIDFSVRGWITTSATWTRTKATMPNMMARWMPRAIG